MNKLRAMRRARTALASGLMAFIAVQLALNVVLDGPGVALRDAEFGGKLGRLNARLEETPEGPLVLLLGSSRSANGVSPYRMASASMRDGRKPLVFNFAMTGHGPVQELILLRGLLRRGIRPDYVLVEIHPCLLYQELGGFSEEMWMHLDWLERGDLSTLRRYVARPGRWTWNWWRPWLVPAHSQRFSILGRLGRWWLEADARPSIFDQIDSLGWLSSPYARPTADDRRRWTENARQSYAPAFERFRVTALADRAIRELLDVCRGEEIAVALFLMPEGSNFRAWYPPAAHGEVAAYLAGLRDEYGVSVFDATSWCDDADFADGHHLLDQAAGRFSERFGRDVVRPFLAAAGNAPAPVARRPGPTTRSK